MWFKQPLHIQKLLDYQVRAKRLRSIENVLRNSTRFVKPAFHGQNNCKPELAESPAPRAAGRPKCNNSLRLTPSLRPIPEPPHTPGGLASQRALIESAHPRRR